MNGLMVLSTLILTRLPMICAREGPTGAIDPVTLATDNDKCITCCRCVSVCKTQARKFKGIMYATVEKVFCAQNSKRREPELYL